MGLVNKKALILWSFGLGGVALVVIGLTVSFWLLPRMGWGTQPANSRDVASNASVRVASRFPSPSREQALESVKQALLNRDPNQVESLFRLGATRHVEVIGFLQSLEGKDGQISRYDWMSSMDTGGILLEGVQVFFTSEDQSGERIAFLTPDLLGNWKVDFDAFARVVAPSWSVILDHQADEALVRVQVGRDVYFNGPFQDESQWACYGMTSPDIDVTLLGYCRIGSVEADAMEQLFSTGVTNSRATLKIRRVEGGESRQFEVVGVMAGDWVVPELPQD